MGKKNSQGGPSRKKAHSKIRNDYARRKKKQEFADNRKVPRGKG